MVKKLVLVTVAVLVSLFLAEVLLRVTGSFKTYNEEIGIGYSTYWGAEFSTHYWLNKPNSTFEENNIDFRYTNVINSLGHRELEPVQLFAASPYRAIVLGDSYTQGVGTVYDSSICRGLDYLSAADSVSCKYYNAGVPGSDPFYSYTVFVDKLKQLKPDLVIVSINPSDYSDYVFRGGMERFKPDGTTQFKAKPPIEPFYHYSHLVRLALSANGYAGETFLKVPDYINEQQKAEEALIALADSFETAAGDADLVFFLHPGRIDELAGEGYFSKLIMTQLETDLKSKGHRVVSVYSAMDSLVTAENLTEYGYSTDGHYTAKGYRVMARFLFQGLNGLGLPRTVAKP